MPSMKPDESCSRTQVHALVNARKEYINLMEST